MIQHCPILKDKEPEIFLEICRIMRRVHSVYPLSSINECKSITVNLKIVEKLPSVYNLQDLAFKVSLFNLKKEDWPRHHTNVALRVHCDENGNVNNIYRYY